jgi:hypothetical protein
LGKNKGRDKNSACREERWNYSCWAKTAVPVDEGSLGGEKKIRQINQAIRTGIPLFLLSAPLLKEAG